MRNSSSIKELIADEVVSPLSDSPGKVTRGIRRIGPARIRFSDRILEIKKVSQASLKSAPRHKRVGSIIPGLIDPHTHLVFAGDRSHEWEARLKGATYQEIARKGGGISYTVKQTQSSSEANLFDRAFEFLDQWIRQGCTTLEIKSGYGLSLESEMKLLKVIQSLKKVSKIQILSSLMAAHKIPKNYTESEYVDEIIEQILPKAAAYADFQDVFVEKNYFGKRESVRLLEAGKKLGLRPRVHAHEFGRTGGVDVACKVGAVSADHLQYLSKRDIQNLKKSKVVPVVLSGTSFFLGSKKFAPAKEMWDAGLPVALASDFNPGTNPGLNLTLVGTLAAVHQQLNLEQVLQAQTKHAAMALALYDRGILAKGYRADLVALECSRFEKIYYHYGSSWVSEVYANGVSVF